MNGFSFGVTFDPAVLQPAANPIDQSNTLSSAFLVSSDTSTAGRLGVAGAGGNNNIAAASGTLIFLRFTVVGTAGTATGTTTLAFEQRAAPNASPDFRDASDQTITSSGTGGAFTVQTAPTAASVTVSGKAVTSAGKGIRHVLVTMTGEDGTVRTAVTNAFGYFRFADAAAGQSYVFAAKSKSYTFEGASQIRNINEETTDITFIAAP